MILFHLVPELGHGQYNSHGGHAETITIQLILTIPWTLISSSKTEKTILTNILTSPHKTKTLAHGAAFGRWPKHAELGVG